MNEKSNDVNLIAMIFVKNIIPFLFLKIRGADWFDFIKIFMLLLFHPFSLKIYNRPTNQCSKFYGRIQFEFCYFFITQKVLPSFKESKYKVHVFKYLELSIKK